MISHYHRSERVPDLKPGQSWVWDTPWKTETKTVLGQVSVASLRADPGYPVKTLCDLIHCVAELSYYNHGSQLLFRGQGSDYRDKNGRTKLYPSIFRPKAGGKQLRKKRITERFAFLDAVIRDLKKQKYKLGFYGPLSAHPEFVIALLQHYEICPTPLLDLTRSVQVAATFALMDEGGNGSRKEGFIFVLDLPHSYGSISNFADIELVLVRLQSICPPDALRPHFQDAYLAGRWPASMEKTQGDNLAYKLIGKYRLDNSDGTFFDDAFRPVPKEALLPEEDPFGAKLKQTVAQTVAKLGLDVVD